MSEIYIVVEGATEQTFVRDVLAPHLVPDGIYLHPARIEKPGKKGGDIRFTRAMNDICTFIKMREDIYVSTMFDYFRIDSSWPGLQNVRQRIRNGVSLTATNKAEMLETATQNKIVEALPEYDIENRFIPYIEMHEFEALLFSDADILSELIEIDVNTIREIIEEYSNPEEINDNPDQAPSKRLQRLHNGYRKVAMGKTISEAVGIQTIRSQCPHFNEWLNKFERL
jgi:hypothetical protein